MWPFLPGVTQGAERKSRGDRTVIAGVDLEEQEDFPAGTLAALTISILGELSI
jgi:hypothetical protein